MDAQDNASLQATLTKRLQDMIQAARRGDHLAIARTYTDDAVLTSVRGNTITGRSALDQHWMQLPRCKDWVLEVLETGGNTAEPFQRLRSTLVLDVNGREIVDAGTCFVVWKQQANGEYQIYVDAYVPASPLPPNKT